MPRTMVARLVSVAEAEKDPEWGMRPPDSPEERLALVVEHSRRLLRLAGFDDEQLRLRRSVAALNTAEAEYLLVGAHALAVHGVIRGTKDLDVWVRPSPDR